MAQWKKIIVSGSVAELDRVIASEVTASFFKGDGSGLTGIATALTLNGGTGTTTVALATETLTVLGTSNQIVSAVDKSGTTGRVTLSLPNSVTISGSTFSKNVSVAENLSVSNNLTVGSNLTVDGNLTVNGDTTVISTANLSVEDKYIALATGTTSGGNGGIIVVSGSIANTEVGFGLVFNKNIVRWGFSKATPVTTTGASVDSYVVSTTFSPTSGLPSSAPGFGGLNNGLGNLHIDTATGDVYIYVESGLSSGGTTTTGDSPGGGALGVG
tara:strand:+ start:2987 stop:3799 length:813 start_codon:yes stop_codon:yes gene_type:complete